MKYSWYFNYSKPGSNSLFLIQLIFDITIEYVLCVLNLIINIFIFYQHRKNSRIKVNNLSRRSNAKAEKNNSKIVKMILFYGLSNFIFKFSKNSIYSWASYKFVNSNNCMNIDGLYEACLLDIYYPALEISNIFYNFSFILNFLIIYCFNDLIRVKLLG